MSRRAGTPVTWAFLAACLAVTLPSLAFPGLYEIFGGLEPRRYPWQLFTAVLEHGWPGFPALVHLGLNAFLILEAGRPCERILGSGRFLLLCLLSASANAVTQILFEGVNGSSLVIWSWGPILFLALRAERRSGPPGRAGMGSGPAGPHAEARTAEPWADRVADGGGEPPPSRARGAAEEPGGRPSHPVLDRERVTLVLAIMYVAVTLIMPLIPYALGWRGNLLYALVMGNIYHLTATAVGAVMALAWRARIRERVADPGPASAGTGP